ncbi:MAG: glutamate formiminotransferase, partial [Nitrospirota bacterium]|nr:glutamate formiminotransferase [Nitrospirota bacterium]
GLPSVKALGFELRSRGQVQVSMNLTNFRETPIHTAYEAVKQEAEQRGVNISGSELVGLIPQEALTETASHDLQLGKLASDQVLEKRMNLGEEL